jgi:hypothetical protein
MPRPIPVPVRQAVFRQWQHGKESNRIAYSLHIAPRTVRQLVRRFRQQGTAGVVPSYPGRPRMPRPAVPAAVRLRQEHPTWGAGLIRVILGRQKSLGLLPSERTLQRWFQRAGLSAAPVGRRPGSNPERAKAPHEVWQMDAKEQTPLQTGQRVSWLRIVDECSGAVLWTAVFPPGKLE